MPIVGFLADLHALLRCSSVPFHSAFQAVSRSCPSCRRRAFRLVYAVRRPMMLGAGQADLTPFPSQSQTNFLAAICSAWQLSRNRQRRQRASLYLSQASPKGCSRNALHIRPSGRSAASKSAPDRLSILNIPSTAKIYINRQPARHHIHDERRQGEGPRRGPVVGEERRIFTAACRRKVRSASVWFCLDPT